MDETSVQRHIDAMMDAEVIAVDTETTGFLVKDGRDYCMGVSVAYRLGILGIVSAYFPFRHQGPGNLDLAYVDSLSRVLRSKPLVLHNGKFDLHSLATLGIDLINSDNKIYCTVNIAHMVNEEWPSKSLEYVSQTLLKKGKEKSAELEGWITAFGWGSVPAGLMAKYACVDAERTLEVFEILWPMMREQELVPLWPIERRFLRLLTKIERRGVSIDSDFCSSKASYGRSRMAEIANDLGYETIGPNALQDLLIDRLALPVLARSEKTDKPSFTKKEMEEYDLMLQKVDSPVARLILEYRGWQKAVTSLYEPLLELVSPDGRVRANFKQHGTRTGRLSCAEPNLQQIPRQSDKEWNGDAKRSFRASDGYDLYGYDYSQLEFRLAAAYGREKWLLDVFNDESRDVFSELAERISETRQSSKTYVYCTMYGGGKGKVALTLGKDISAIEENYALFRESIAGIRHVSEVAQKRAKERGFVKYWTGRRRHFPYTEGHHKAFNSLLQGGGAELVKRAMIAIDDDVENIPHDVARIVLQVHDEIVFEIKEGYREQVEPFIVKHMTNFPEFGVQLKVEGKVWNK